MPEQAGTGWDTRRFGSEDKPTDFYMYVYVVVFCFSRHNDDCGALFGVY